jgi:hypothetical protein
VPDGRSQPGKTKPQTNRMRRSLRPGISLGRHAMWMRAASLFACPGRSDPSARQLGRCLVVDQAGATWKGQFRLPVTSACTRSNVAMLRAVTGNNNNPLAPHICIVTNLFPRTLYSNTYYGGVIIIRAYRLRSTDGAVVTRNLW